MTNVALNFEVLYFEIMKGVTEVKGEEENFTIRLILERVYDLFLEILTFDTGLGTQGPFFKLVLSKCFGCHLVAAIVHCFGQ